MRILKTLLFGPFVYRLGRKIFIGKKTILLKTHVWNMIFDYIIFHSFLKGRFDSATGYNFRVRVERIMFISMFRIIRY